MPYRAPTFGGLFRKSLVIKESGAVESDGEYIGTIVELQMTPIYMYVNEYLLGQGNSQSMERIEYSLRFAVIPQHPDEVRGLDGKIIGHLRNDGFHPLEEGA